MKELKIYQINQADKENFDLGVDELRDYVKGPNGGVALEKIFMKFASIIPVDPSEPEPTWTDGPGGAA